MRAVVPAVLALLAACWTGAPPPAAPQVSPPPRDAAPPAGLEIRLQRTACMGRCPTFEVLVHGDGRLAWTGGHDVAASGPRAGRIPRARVAELARVIDEIRFFELDPSGRRPVKPQCTTTRTPNGSTTTCSFQSFSICSDTSHAILRVRRGAKVHEVDSAGCSDEREVRRLVEAIERLPPIAAWIGAP